MAGRPDRGRYLRGGSYADSGDLPGLRRRIPRPRRKRGSQGEMRPLRGDPGDPSRVARQPLGGRRDGTPGGTGGSGRAAGPPPRPELAGWRVLGKERAGPRAAASEAARRRGDAVRLAHAAQSASVVLPTPARGADPGDFERFSGKDRAGSHAQELSLGDCLGGGGDGAVAGGVRGDDWRGGVWHVLSCGARRGVVEGRSVGRGPPCVVLRADRGRGDRRVVYGQTAVCPIGRARGHPIPLPKR